MYWIDEAAQMTQAEWERCMEVLSQPSKPQYRFVAYTTEGRQRMNENKVLTAILTGAIRLEARVQEHNKDLAQRRERDIQDRERYLAPERERIAALLPDWTPKLLPSAREVAENEWDYFPLHLPDLAEIRIRQRNADEGLRMQLPSIRRYRKEDDTEVVALYHSREGSDHETDFYIAVYKADVLMKEYRAIEAQVAEHNKNLAEFRANMPAPDEELSSLEEASEQLAFGHYQEAMGHALIAIAKQLEELRPQRDY